MDWEFRAQQIDRLSERFPNKAFSSNNLKLSQTNICKQITNFLEQNVNKRRKLFFNLRPEVVPEHLGGDVVKVNLNQSMSEVLSTLSKYPIKTRLSLSGTLIVARDIAHAKLKERLDKGESLPQYLKDYPVYYAGPAKTPSGFASGSFGPTTSSRMDSYVDQFQAAGGSMVMLAKGNRSKEVTAACKKHGGFYLGSIGGPAAILAQNCIKKVELIEYPELGGRKLNVYSFDFKAEINRLI